MNACESHELKDEAVAQKTLMHQYRLLASRGDAWLPSMNDVGFRKYSQFEEDGILLYLFSLIPPINRTCVEICAGDGRECNTANLIINHGWWGHLFDGNEQNVNSREDVLLPEQGYLHLSASIYQGLDHSRARQ